MLTLQQTINELLTLHPHALDADQQWMETEEQNNLIELLSACRRQKDRGMNSEGQAVNERLQEQLQAELGRRRVQKQVDLANDSLKTITGQVLFAFGSENLRLSKMTYGQQILYVGRKLGIRYKEIEKHVQELTRQQLLMIENNIYLSSYGQDKYNTMYAFATKPLPLRRSKPLLSSSYAMLRVSLDMIIERTKVNNGTPEEDDIQRLSYIVTEASQRNFVDLVEESKQLLSRVEGQADNNN